MSMYVKSNQILTLADADTDILLQDTGKVLITPQTARGAASTYTLPVLRAGLHYQFINGAAGALNGNIDITAPANIMYGRLVNGPTNGVEYLAVNQSTTV